MIKLLILIVIWLEEESEEPKTENSEFWTRRLLEEKG